MSKHYRKTFAGQLRLQRLLRGWSQERLAEEAGLHRTYVGAIERAERNICLDNIVKIAVALNMDVADLFKVSVSVSDISQCEESTAIYSRYPIKPQINTNKRPIDAYMRHFAIYSRSTVLSNFPVMPFHEHISKEAPGTQYQTSTNPPWLVSGNTF
ncbi:MAG: helix-turn-helix transcriptional regulator [Gammaproteobacteria bacterium]